MSDRVRLSQKERFATHTLPFLKQMLQPAGPTKDAECMWQTFDDAGTNRKGMVRMVHGSLQELYQDLEQLNLDGAGVFVTVNRTTPSGRTKKDITHIRALWADLDEKDASLLFEPSVVPLGPTMIVRSGHGTHLYWVLPQPVEVTPQVVAQTEDLLRRICFYLKPYGADPKVCEIARVMRVPGFYNMKAEPYPLVELVFQGGLTYNLDQIADAFPPLPPKTQAQGRTPLPAAEDKGNTQDTQLDRATVMEWANEYLEGCEPAVAGDRGHDTTFLTALKVISGFDLTPEEAWEVLSLYNESCDPPWSDRELIHKIKDSYRIAQESDRRGWMIRRRQKPVIRIGNESQMVLASIEALAPHQDVYSRKGRLYRILVANNSHPTIDPTNPYWLREVLSKRGFFCTKKDSTGELKPHQVPESLPLMILARGEWPGVDELRAIVETPVFLSDGRTLVEPGFDEESGLYVVPHRTEYPPVGESPSRADAEAALACLYDLVRDFPFAHVPGPEAHRAAWLSFVLTIVARFAIDGPVPFGLFDASTAGSGKGLLLKISAMIALGRIPGTMPSVSNEDELRKRLILPLIAGDRLAWVDDAESPFGGPSWNALITSYPDYQDRVLGKSETIKAPSTTVWGVTGNNLTLRGDSPRRAIHIRLEPQTANPEDRDGFAIPDVLGYARDHHPDLLAAALTILKTYHNAGSPESGLPALGSFEAWSRRIRDCVYWITGEDVTQTQRSLGCITDQSNTFRLSLLDGLYQLYRDRPFSTLDLFDRLTNPDEENEYGTVKQVSAAVEQLKRGSGNLSARSLGWVMSSVRNQIHGDFQLLVSAKKAQGYTYQVSYSGVNPKTSSEVSEVFEVFSSFPEENRELSYEEMVALISRGAVGFPGTASEKPQKPQKPQATDDFWASARVS